MAGPVSETEKLCRSEGFVSAATIFICHLCDELYNNKTEYDRHISSHTEQAQFLPKKELKVKIEKFVSTSSSENIVVRCNVCNNVYKSQLELEKHIASHNSSATIQKVTSTKPITFHRGLSAKKDTICSSNQPGVVQMCHLCDKVYDNQSSLKDHLLTHCEHNTEGQIEKLKDWTDNFEFATGFVAPVYKNADVPMEHVVRCNLSPGSASVEATHLRSKHLHNNMENYDCNGSQSLNVLLCKFCDNIFKSHAALYDHLLIHQKLLTHKCHNNLKVVIKPFVQEHTSKPLNLNCNRCDKSFKQQRDLDKHLLSHVKVTQQLHQLTEMPKRSKLKRKSSTKALEDVLITIDDSTGLTQCDDTKKTKTNKECKHTVATKQPKAFKELTSTSVVTPSHACADLHKRTPRTKANECNTPSQACADLHKRTPRTKANESNTPSQACADLHKRTPRTKANESNTDAGLEHNTISELTPNTKTSTNNTIDGLNNNSAKMSRYECQLCIRIYQTKGDLDAHMRTFYHRPAKYHCKMCNEPFGVHKRMRDHMRVAHGYKEDFTCHICHLTFTMRTNLVTHMRAKHDIKSGLKCVACRRTFKCYNDLEVHEEEHRGERIIQCTQCEYECVNRETLAVHRQTIHPLSETLTRINNLRDEVLASLEKTHKCYICNQMFTENEIQNHLETSHVDNQTDRQEQCDGNTTREVLPHAEIPENENEPMLRNLLGLYKTEPGASSDTLSAPSCGDIVELSDLPDVTTSITCHFCDKMFEFEEEFQTHLAIHFEGDEFSDSPEDSTEQGVGNIELTTTSDTIPRDKYKLTCTVCMKLFDDPTDLEFHLISHGNMAEEAEQTYERHSIDIAKESTENHTHGVICIQPQNDFNSEQHTQPTGTIIPPAGQLFPSGIGRPVAASVDPINLFDQLRRGPTGMGRFPFPTPHASTVPTLDPMFFSNHLRHLFSGGIHSYDPMMSGAPNAIYAPSMNIMSSANAVPNVTIMPTASSTTSAYPHIFSGLQHGLNSNMFPHANVVPNVNISANVSTVSNVNMLTNPNIFSIAAAQSSVNPSTGSTTQANPPIPIPNTQNTHAKSTTSTPCTQRRKSSSSANKSSKGVGKSMRMQCSYCYSEFRNIKDLARHVEEEHDKKLPSCSACKKVFKNRRSLTLHEKSTECRANDKGKSPSDDSSKQNDLQFGYTKYVGVNNIQMEHSNALNVTVSHPVLLHALAPAVPLPGDASSAVSIPHPFYVGANIPPPVYSNFPHARTAQITNANTKHMKTVLSGGVASGVSGGVTCPDCGRVFTQRSSMNRHRRLICSDRFAAKKAKCEVCSESFLNKGRLLLHKAREHGIPTSDKVSFRCRFCAEKFGNKNALLLHLRNKHRNSLPTCEYCNLICFTTTRARQLHLKNCLALGLVAQSDGFVPSPQSNGLVPLPQSNGVVPLPQSNSLVPLPHSDGLVPLPQSNGLVPLPHSGGVLPIDVDPILPTPIK